VSRQKLRRPGREQQSEDQPGTGVRSDSAHRVTWPLRRGDGSGHDLCLLAGSGTNTWERERTTGEDQSHTWQPAATSPLGDSAVSFSARDMLFALTSFLGIVPELRQHAQPTNLHIGSTVNAGCTGLPRRSLSGNYATCVQF